MKTVKLPFGKDDQKSPRISAGLLLVSVIIRVFSAVMTLDAKTGMIIPEYKAVSIVFGVLSFVLAAAAVIVMCYFTSFSPSAIKPSVSLTVLSFLFAIFSLIDGFDIQSNARVAKWQISAVAVAGIVNALFFAAYGISELIKINLPKYLFAVPFIYSVVKIIRFFAVTTSITLITDNVFSLVFYSSAIFFFLEFANVSNAIGGKTSLKRLRLSGYATAVSSVLCALPRIAEYLVLRDAVAHDSAASTILVLVIGGFATVLTINVFDKSVIFADNN